MSLTISCPTCGEQLEVPPEMIGGQVRCGNCLGIFTATAPTGSAGRPDEIPVARPNRRPNNVPVSRAGDSGPIERDPSKPRAKTGIGCGVWAMLGLFSLLGCGCCGGLVWFVVSMMSPDYQDYASPDGRFKAVFPVPPAEVRKTTRVTGRKDGETAPAVEATRPLIQEQFYIYHVDLSAMEQLIPPVGLAKLFGDGLLKVTGASELSRSQRTHQGFEAIELHGKLPNRQFLQARVIVTDDRVYVAAVAGPGNPDGSPWVEEFLDRLDIQPAGDKPAEKKAERKPEKKPEPKAEPKNRPKRDPEPDEKKADDE
jgi:hypothetical protein